MNFGETYKESVMSEDEQHEEPTEPTEPQGDSDRPCDPEPVPVLVVEPKRRSRAKAKSAPRAVTPVEPPPVEPPPSPPSPPPAKPKRAPRPKKVAKPAEAPVVEAVPQDPLHQQVMNFHNFSASIRELHKLGEQSKRERYQSLLAGMR